MSEAKPITIEEVFLFSEMEDTFREHTAASAEAVFSNDPENPIIKTVLEGVIEITAARATLVRKATKTAGESALFTLIANSCDEIDDINAQITTKGCIFTTPDGQENRADEMFVELMRYTLGTVAWDKQLSEIKAAELSKSATGVHEMMAKIRSTQTQPEV